VRVTLAEAALLLGISEPTARRRVRSGELPGTQVPTPQGFTWMVDLPDDIPTEPSPSEEVVSEEVVAMRVSMARMEAQITAQEVELEARRREVQELHVLLQQAQSALPSPRGTQRPWWRFWRR
jgi:hypothetical protein